MSNTDYQILYEQYKCLVQHTTWQEVKHLLDQDHKTKLIDVRELVEWQADHVQGAIHIPRSDLITSIKKNVPDLTTPLLVYCARGIRSVVASYELAQIGYTNRDEAISGSRQARPARQTESDVTKCFAGQPSDDKA